MKRVQRVAVVGECMLELQGEAFGTMRQTFGGDTLNAAVYLARLAGARGVEVQYATAVGTDSLSEGLLTRWQAEGVGVALVQRLPDRLPGLYLIEVDDAGERRFSYWRGQSAARAYFDGASSPLEDAANRFDALYLSGISLAILPPAGRERLLALMGAMRARGALVAFDNNYRPRLWTDAAEARAVFTRAFAQATLALVTADDHQALMGLATLEEGIAAARALPAPELVIKRGAQPTLVRAAGVWAEAAVERVDRVVDTTAAGDSFAAGYLACRLLGAGAEEAARFGNRVAARVIQHRGALIPLDAMTDLAAELPVAA